MRIEIDLDEIGLKLSHPIAFGFVEESVREKFKLIAEKHRKAMIAEFDELATKFTVAIAQDCHKAASKIIITTPDA